MKFVFHLAIDNRVALRLVDDWAAQFRRVYGYVGEIKLLPADKECGTRTPAMLQVVVRLPFRYGKNPLETRDSWLDCRVTAFMSAWNRVLPRKTLFSWGLLVLLWNRLSLRSAHRLVALLKAPTVKTTLVRS